MPPMEWMQHIFPQNVMEALGWTVLHTLWQGVFIALLTALGSFFLQRQPARLRYAWYFGALLLMLFTGIATFAALFSAEPEEVLWLTSGLIFSELPSPSAAVEATEPCFLQRCLTYFDTHLPVIVATWLLGALFFFLRLLGGYAWVLRLQQEGRHLLPQSYQQQLRGLARRMGIRRRIPLAETALVRVPMVVGFFKPVILLPLGTVNALSPKEVEAVLAHELSHIFRNDYLRNLLQSFIEVLFYYHPAVWWLSANIRRERELSCDELAVRLCDDSLEYAKALVSLQEISGQSPALAMAFGKKKHLLYRIKHILQPSQKRSQIMEKLIATFALAAGVLLWSFSGPAPGEQPERPGPDIQVETVVGKLATVVVTAADTLPPDAPKAQKRVEKIVRQDDNERTEITLEDGKLKTLEINGEQIPPSEFDKYRNRVDGILAELPPPPPAPPAPPAGLDIPEPPAPPAAPSGEEMPEPPAPPVFYEIQIQGIEEEGVPSGKRQWLDKKGETHVFDLKRTPSKKTTEIRTEKDDNGNTVLLISDPEGGKPIRVVVDENGNSVEVDGNKLQEGETAIVIDETKPTKGNFFFRSSGKDEAVVVGERALGLAEIRAKVEARSKEAEELMRLREKEIEEKVIELRKKRGLNKQNLEAHRKVLENDRHMEAHERALEKGLRFEADNIVIRGGEGTAFFSRTGNQNLHNSISEQLRSDGLIENAGEFDFSLSASKLKVNGKKQSAKLHRKYKKLVEKNLNVEGLSKKDQIDIQVKGDNVSTRVQLSEK